MVQRIRINFTDFWHGDSLQEKLGNPLCKLLQKRFELEFTSKPDFLIYSCFGVEFSRHTCTRIFYAGENVRPDFRHCDYAFTFDYPVTDRNFRYPLYGLSKIAPLFAPRDVDAVLAEKTRFCAFVFSNPRARERIDFMERLSRYKKVDCGGRVNNNIGFLVEDKLQFLRPYKFSIAFENSSWPGYTTEKLPEAMLASTVPVYWGNPLVHRDFNTRAFINCHDYRSMDEAVAAVIELDRDETLYRRYLGETAFVDNRPNEFIADDAVLDRFEQIFTSPPAQPVALSRFSKLMRICLAPRGFRRRRRQGKRRSPVS